MASAGRACICGTHLRAFFAPAMSPKCSSGSASCSRIADFEPPQALLHWLLVGPWQGRRRLVARLGTRGERSRSTNLLNAAHAYASAQLRPALQGFLNWFDAGEGELKREAGNSEGLVRVMTVHGAKGLAGADRDPGRRDGRSRQPAGARAGARQQLPGGGQGAQ